MTSRPDVLLLNRSHLEQTLDFKSVLDALEQAFRAEADGRWDTPKRIAAHTKAGSLLAMPCAGGTPESLGAKLVTTFGQNSGAGLPGVSGLYALFDAATGVPLAVMDGAYLTLVRTASVSALATRLLSRSEASTLGVLGSGAQAEFHIRLIATVRPIRRVVVWARRPDAAAAIVARLRIRDDLSGVSEWLVTARPEEAADCDVVVTATGAVDPILRGAWLRDGSHVNAIGAHTRTTRELDTDAVTRAGMLLVETDDTLLEAGELQMAESEAGGVVARALTIGALLGRSGWSNESRTSSVFKSCGVAFEDLATARLAFARATDRGLGTRFSFA